MIRRYLLLILLTVILCATVACAGLIVLFGTPVGLNLVRRTAEWGSKQVVQGRITIGRVDGSLWGRLVIHDLSMALPDSLGGEVIGAERVEVVPDLWALLTGRYLLKTVTVDGFRLSYIDGVGPRKTDNVSILFGLGQGPPSTTPEPPVPLAIPHLTVTRGRFLYFDRGDSTTFRAQNVSFRGVMTDTEHLSGNVQAERATFVINGFQDSLSTLTSEVRLHGDALTIAQLTAQATAPPLLTMQVAGEIAPLSTYTAALTLRAEGDAGAIARLIDSEMQWRGPFHLTGSLTHTVIDPSIEADLDAPALDTELGHVDQTTIHLQYADDRLTITRYAGLTEAGWVSGSGLLDVSQPVERYRLTLAPSTLALGRVPRRLIGRELPLAGEATAQAELSGVGFDHPILRGTASVTIPSLVVAGTPVGALSAQTAYDRGRVTLIARTPTAALEAKGTLTMTGETDVSATLAVPNLRAFATVFGDSTATGSGSLTATVRGAIDRPEVQVNGQIVELGYAGVRLGMLHVTGSLDPSGVARVHTDLDSNTVTLAVQTDVTRDRRLTGTVAVHRFRLRDHLTALNQDWNLDGVVEVEGTLQGSLDRPEFRGNGLLRDLSIRGEYVGSTSLAVTLNRERDLLFTLVTSDFSVISNGLLRLTDGLPFDVRLTVTQGDLSPFLAVFNQQKTSPYRGRVTGQVRALGLAEHPALSTVTLTLDSLVVARQDQGIQLATPSHIRLEKQVVTVDHLELAGDAGRVRLQGLAGLTDDGPIDLQLALDGAQLEFLSPLVFPRGSLEGQVDVRVAMTGSPAAPVLNGTVKTGSIRYSWEKRSNDLGAVTASVTYADRVFRIPVLALDTPFGTSRATATFPIDLSWAGPAHAPVDEHFIVSVLMDHLSIGPLREFIPDIPRDLDGRINGMIDVTGPTANPSASTGTVRLDSLRVYTGQYELVNVDSLLVRFDAGHLDVDALQVAFHQLDQRHTEVGRLTATGRVALSSHNSQIEPSDLTVMGRGIALDAPIDLAGLDEPITGLLNGDVRLTGPLSAQSLEGRIQVEHVRYDSASVDSIAGRFVYERGDLILHEFRAWIRGNSLIAYGTIPLDQASTESGSGRPADMALTVEGSDLDLRFLSGITYDLEQIEGKADVHLTVGGTPFAPKSVGTLVIRDGKVHLRDLNPSFQVAQLRLVVDGDRITLEPVVIKAGRGTIRLDGYTVLRNLSPTEFESKATANNAELELVGSAKLTVNGTLSLTGDSNRSRVTGQRLVLNGTITEPLNLQELILGGGIARPPSVPSSFLERIALNIPIDLPQLRVRNALADVGVEGGIAMTGTGQNPILTGNVSATDGFIMYLGTKFELANGRLEITKREPAESFSAILDDPINQLDPIVTLQAKASQVSDVYGAKYDVELSINGRVIQPTLVLDATPILALSPPITPATPLHGGDVVSLLTFGLPGLRTPPPGVLGGATGTFAGVGSRALMMVAGKQAQQLLRLDEVRIEGDIFGTPINKGTEPMVTISKRINRRTEVTYTQSVAYSSQYKIRVGYRLSDLIFIETSTDQTLQEPQNGIDLKLKFRFR